MNTLNFNGKVYELIECRYPNFIIYDVEKRYEDIGTATLQHGDPFRYYCRSLHIKDKFYALKLVEPEKS